VSDDKKKADEKKKRFTTSIKCGHCHNSAPMEIVAEYSGVKDHYDGGNIWEAGPFFEVCKCPACDGITLRRANWHEMMDPSEIEFIILYPSSEKALRGLPKKIEAGYQAAQKVRNVDPNAYGVLLGRVLDSVCEDRHAMGDTLDKRLKSLASNGEIPTKLVDVAAGIRRLRNVGAHADLGELTEAELPVLDDLTRAILEYVYSAPLLAEEAEKRFAKLKASGATRKPAKKK
jgi:hypothetical protein